MKRPGVLLQQPHPSRGNLERLISQLLLVSLQGTIHLLVVCYVSINGPTRHFQMRRPRFLPVSKVAKCLRFDSYTEKGVQADPKQKFERVQSATRKPLFHHSSQNKKISQTINTTLPNEEIKLLITLTKTLLLVDTRKAGKTCG